MPGNPLLPVQKPVFQVGSIPVFGDLILSPMDGYSDQPFRSLCRQLGSAMSYTEFLNALDVLQGHPQVAEKTAYLPEERPVVFQLYDSEPDRLAAAARQLRELNPDIIDINLGCSVRRIAGRGAGAGLLRTPLKVARIFRRLNRELDLPVTGKIRLGWDDNQRNYCQIARIIQEEGGALIAVHGRTRSQGYGVQADWDAIAEIKQSVSIPVIGNGDVRTVADVERMLAHTGCDAIMIGRGAIGNPWIFSRLDREQVSADRVREMMTRHLAGMLAFYPGDYGLILFRKHASQYISPQRLTGSQRKRLMTAAAPREFLDLLDEILEQPPA